MSEDSDSTDEKEGPRGWFRPKKRKVLRDTGKVGGFPFYLSLIFLLLLASFCFAQLPRIIAEADPSRLITFAASAAVGALIAWRLIRGKFSVFLHELKHSIISNLAGNKARSWKIKENSGHFEYEYTKSTAHYNAIISLAPYFLPITLVIATLLVIVFARSSPQLALILIGLGWGVDIVLNLRDISPIQTDFSQVNGGFGIGVMYVAGMNIVVLTLVLAWVSSDVPGLAALWRELWGLVYQLTNNVRQPARQPVPIRTPARIRPTPR